jgi:tetratricopeptide (TPR) repeat protein
MGKATDKQLVFQDDEIVKILNEIYALFKRGRFSEAIEPLEGALKIDFDYPGVTSSLKCANFWKEKQNRLEELSNSYELGETLMSNWRHFLAFVERIGDVPEKCLFSIKRYVFTTALDSFQSLYEASGIYDSDVLLRMGRCHKALGNYERAIELLETASQQKSGTAEILAELADSYSLINETRASKAFFREAFFLNPQEIDLHNIESVIIHRLADKLRKKGLRDSELLEWIPVYGTIYGVFNVKRELRPIEFGKLKQAIYKIEGEIKKKSEKAAHSVPRLINRFFWLIDHYVSTNEEKSRIEEVLEKIKALDPVIFREYTK